MALAFEGVQGRLPTLPWQPGELQRVLGVVAELATSLTPTRVMVVDWPWAGIGAARVVLQMGLRSCWFVEPEVGFDQPVSPHALTSRHRAPSAPRCCAVQMASTPGEGVSGESLAWLGWAELP